MTSVARPTRTALHAPRPILRGVLGLVALAALLVVVIDLATAWRTRDAAGQALTALAAPTATGGASCTLVGLRDVEARTEASLCGAKAATGLAGLDVRLRIEAVDGSTVACSMTHRRSATGLLGMLLDDVTTERRIVDVGAEPPATLSEAPFVGLSWDFCAG